REHVRSRVPARLVLPHLLWNGAAHTLPRPHKQQAYAPEAAVAPSASDWQRPRRPDACAAREANADGASWPSFFSLPLWSWRFETEQFLILRSRRWMLKRCHSRFDTQTGRLAQRTSRSRSGMQEIEPGILRTKPRPTYRLKLAP